MLDLIAAWPGALWLQSSGTAYMLVNAAHILGIALLVGGIVPLDVLLARNAPGGELLVLARILPRAAACGLGLAVLTGLWLFSVRPTDYVGNPAFLFKLALLALAVGNIAWQHFSGDWGRVLKGDGASRALRIRAILSVALWVSVVLAGRWIGFL
ncbi:DUF2214 domain-containing protein [Variovorax sp. HJSM1_2]|uniref:DUF2214 domain-containing protein n=1 Tax=Variovorax sp. HJSM1_2 TaxID=3366263 RepID=UPI003BD70869